MYTATHHSPDGTVQHSHTGTLHEIHPAVRAMFTPDPKDEPPTALAYMRLTWIDGSYTVWHDTAAPPVPHVDYEPGRCDVCGSADTDMSKHQACFAPDPYPDPEDTYPGRV